MALPDPAAESPLPPPPAPRSAPAEDNARGAAWMMLSVFFASAMTLAVPWAALELDSRMIVTLRAIGGVMICLAGLALIPRLRKELRFSSPWRHVWRGALIGVSTQFGFYALTALPLTLATVLFFTAPIFAAMLAVPMQGERIGLRRASAIGAGFLGVLIVLRPGTAGFDLAMLAALVSSVLFAMALLSSRGLSVRDGPFAAYLSSAAMSVLISLPIALPVWSLPVSGGGWAALAIVVVASLTRNIGDLQAYRWAEASLLAPLSYLRLILIALGAWLLYAEIPDGWTLTGGAVIVGAALYIARRERLAKRGG